MRERYVCDSEVVGLELFHNICHVQYGNMAFESLL